jgi:alkylation response protein AidB-like acyl-CoA dehydrogenase
MEFAWTAEHKAFRQRLKDVLKQNLPADWPQKSRYDTSSEYVSKFSRTFCPNLAKEGLLIPHWPKEVGGGGVDAFHHWILGEEMFAEGDPRSYQYMNVNWCGPAILKYGTDEQIKEHIGGIASGTQIWCQGFSEPQAGSDLAALATRAERTQAGYRINGSKIWTSGASLADKCFMLARTGAERHAGISVFLVPMKTKGVEVRRIQSFMGERSVHEVFFTDVELPESARLGDESKGWEIVGHVLNNERIGAPRYSLAERALHHAVGVLKRKNRWKDDVVKMRAARAQSYISAARQLCLQVINDRVQKKPVNPITNVARYSIVAADRQIAEFVGDYLGDELIGAKDPLLFQAYRRTGSTGIAAGAAEIQLNLIARNLLKLPRD